MPELLKRGDYVQFGAGALTGTVVRIWGKRLWVELPNGQVQRTSMKHAARVPSPAEIKARAAAVRASRLKLKRQGVRGF